MIKHPIKRIFYITLAFLTVFQPSIFGSTTLAPSSWIKQINPAELWWQRQPAEIRELTVGSLFRRQVQKYRGRAMMKVKRNDIYEDISWDEAYRRVRNLSLGLLNRFGDDVSVAVLSENRPEMAMLDFACVSAGIPYVPISTESTESDLSYILKDFKPKVIVVSNKHFVAKVWDVVKSLEEIPQIVVIDQETEDNLPCRTFDLSDIDNAGIENKRNLDFETICDQISKDKIITWLYTSGSSGIPKGVGFTQKNIISKRVARAETTPGIGSDDIFMCYLPLYHTFGRWFELYGTLYWGSTYVFTSFDPKKRNVLSIIGQLQELKPTIFISVPIIWTEILNLAQSELPENATDEMLYRKLEEKTGSRLRFALSGGGALDDSVFAAFNNAGIPLSSGFGMTEATGGISMTPFRKNLVPGTVGAPLPGIHLSLDTTVLDQENGQTSRRGELIISGPYVTPGYRDPQMNRDVFTDDGGMKTGDIAEFDEHGNLKIVGRRKDIIKLSNGRTVSPIKFESMIGVSKFIKYVCTAGDGRPYIVALIQPDWDAIKLDFERADIPFSHAKVYQVISYIVRDVNTSLARHERIHNFRLITSFDPSLITPKGTVKRDETVERYRTQINQMYEQGITSDLLTRESTEVPPGGLLDEEDSLTMDIEGIGAESCNLDRTIRYLSRLRADKRREFGRRNVRHAKNAMVLIEHADIDSASDYLRLRQELTVWYLYAYNKELNSYAREARRRLRSRLNDVLASEYYEGTSPLSDSRVPLLINFEETPPGAKLRPVSERRKDLIREALNQTLLIPEIVWLLTDKMVHRDGITGINIQKVSAVLFQEIFKVTVSLSDGTEIIFKLAYGRKDLYEDVTSEGAYQPYLEERQEAQMELSGGKTGGALDIDENLRDYPFEVYGGHWHRFNLATSEFIDGVSLEEYLLSLETPESLENLWNRYLSLIILEIIHFTENTSLRKYPISISFDRLILKKSRSGQIGETPQRIRLAIQEHVAPFKGWLDFILDIQGRLRQEAGNQKFRDLFPHMEVSIEVFFDAILKYYHERTATNIFTEILNSIDEYSPQAHKMAVKQLCDFIDKLCPVASGSAESLDRGSEQIMGSV